MIYVVLHIVNYYGINYIYLLKLNVKIIKDYLKISLPLQKAEKETIAFFNKNKLPTKNIKNYFKKIVLINKKIGKKYSIIFKTDFGRNAEYYTGIVFLAYTKKKNQIVELARGGEYSNLLKTLGYKKDIPALVGAINLKQLINL